MKTKKNISVGAALLSLLLLIPSVSLSAEPRSETRVKVLTFHNPSSFQRDEVVEVKGSELYKALGVKTGTSVVVKDKRGNEVTSQWDHDGNLLVVHNDLYRCRGSALEVPSMGLRPSRPGT